jgi:hypothetical protein
MRKLSCDEAADALGVPHLHCDSCHEDADEYGISLMELTLPDGKEASVCCKMAEALFAKDFPYPGENMVASQNDLLATQDELRHAEANVAFYTEKIERLETEIEELLYRMRYHKLNECKPCNDAMRKSREVLK